MAETKPGGPGGRILDWSRFFGVRGSDVELSSGVN